MELSMRGKQAIVRLFRRAVHAARGSEVTVPIRILALVLGLTVVSLAWLAYRATQEWRRSATMVVERRVDDVAALLITALIRDMRGAQESILAPLSAEHLDPDVPYEIIDRVSRAFSRFPYPESFFAWIQQEPRNSAVLFNRTERMPRWEKSGASQTTFPVTIVRDSAVAAHLGRLAGGYAMPRTELASFETNFEGIPYQIVARFIYRGNSGKDVFAIVGFTVNLDWVRREYFSEITGQIERIEGNAGAPTLSLSIVDDDGKLVTQTRPPNGGGPLRETEFPFAFFDSLSAPGAALVDMPLRRWTARVAAADDPLLGAAVTGARRTLMLILAAAAVAVVSLLLAARSLLANFDLVAMKAEFIAMMSHELKTPLASIRMVGDTLSKRRYTEQSVADYGALISTESIRLTRLIENVLTFSRITDSKNVYRMTNVDIAEAVTETVERLRPQIAEKEFHVGVQIVRPLHTVVCDREAMINVFENLIVNAIKYSEDSKNIEICVFNKSNHVNVSVADTGRGVLPEDIPYIFEKFYRGKNSGFNGSGLGLAIAHRIVKDHRGDIFIVSTPGEKTVLTVALPASGGIE